MKYDVPLMFEKLQEGGYYQHCGSSYGPSATYYKILKISDYVIIYKAKSRDNAVDERIVEIKKQIRRQVVEEKNG